jgi:8-oxo-dGTP diphosphatase
MGAPLLLITQMNRYVLGFMFDEKFEKVLLVRKQKPAWQKGLLNGPGGKIENPETAIGAMVREFKEETGIDHPTWKHYCSLSGLTPDGARFEVLVFATIGEPEKWSVTPANMVESVEVHNSASFTPVSEGAIENLCWLIALAIDNLRDGRPYFVTANY